MTAVGEGLRAGTARIRSVAPMLGRLAEPDGSAVMVPFLVVDEDQWRLSTSGQPLDRLVELLHREGGFWLAEHLDGRVRWCVAPCGEPRVPWLRLDVTCTGPWQGTFALSAPAASLASSLWMLGGSPVFGVVTERLGRQVLRTPDSRDPVLDLDSFEIRLNRCLHLRADPPNSVRQLVISSGWPGAEQLADLP
ncbi:hypothetical protein JOF53_006997 [Crossiella equi]|uniref:Uncharacterized protein n=1 Tax=Crossiella equi TaxID=130796 RepID=A0ABS5ANG4_9PSEU|nr:hypothetical protein [Crossiella equi]MBP2478125.1 hypothetical protein [Crossiella equi]